MNNGMMQMIITMGMVSVKMFYRWLTPRKMYIKEKKKKNYLKIFCLFQWRQLIGGNGKIVLIEIW